MLNIKVKNRLSIFIALSVISIVVIIFIFKALEDNVLYFYSPSEIKNKSDVILKKNIKIGGMVKNGSIQTNKNEIKLNENSELHVIEYIVDEFNSKFILDTIYHFLYNSQKIRSKIVHTDSRDGRGLQRQPGC